MKISNLYVPINYSEISKSVPEDDEILYSTLCHAKSTNQNWESHILITKLGIAYSAPTENDQEKITFINWLNVHKNLLNEFKAKKIKITGIWFSAIRDEKHETEKVFKSRVKEFGKFCKNLFQNTENEYITWKESEREKEREKERQTELDFIRNNSDLYVPIDYTDLHKIVPKDEEILYSTFCSLKLRVPRIPPSTFSKFSYKKFPPSQVLITRRGMALVDVIEKRLTTLRPKKFIQWHKFMSLKFKREEIRHGPSNKKKILKVVMVGEFESQETFNARKDIFSSYCQLLFKRYTQQVSELGQSMYHLINVEKISETNYNNAIEIGKELLLGEQCFEALKLFDEILKIIPKEERYIIMYYKAEAHRIDKNYGEALKFYDIVLRLDPSNIDALKRKFLILMDNNVDINYDNVKDIETLYKENIPIKSFVMSSNNKFLISNSDEKVIVMREFLTGEIAQTLKKTLKVKSFGISRDGRFLASGDINGKINLWDLPLAKVYKSLKKHKGSINSLVFSPDDKLLVSSSTDGTIKIWDLSNGKLIQSIKIPNSVIKSTIFTTDSKYLISCSTDKSQSSRKDKILKIWDASTWQLFKTFTVIDTTVEENLYYHQDHFSINSIDISPDGNHIVSGSKDGKIEIWDFNDGSIKNTIQGHKDEINVVKVTPNGKYIVSGSNDKSIRIWDFSTGNLIKSLMGHTMEINAVEITSDNNFIISGSNDKAIIIWKGNLT